MGINNPPPNFSVFGKGKVELIKNRRIFYNT